MKKYGIEFEMVVYYDDPEKLSIFHQALRQIGQIASDSSIHNQPLIDYENHEEIEFQTKIYSDIELLMKDIEKAFLGNDFAVSINSNGGDIRIDFNQSTGMHIHYSDVDEDMPTPTPEIYAFGNEEILQELVKKITEKCEYDGIKKDFIRQYTDQVGDICQARHKAINVSNWKNGGQHLGTIEFRLFNLHGIRTEDLLRSVKHQIDLLNMAIETGWALVNNPKEKITYIEKPENRIYKKEMVV